MKIKFALSIFPLLSLIFFGAKAQVPELQMRKPHLVNPPTVAPAKGYSHAVQVDMGPATMVILSGQVPIDAQGKLVGEGDVSKQAQQIFANLKHVLEAAGGNMSHIVKLGIYMVDISQIQAVREVRDKYITTAAPPASTAVQVSKLVRDEWLLEVEATAVIPKKVK